MRQEYRGLIQCGLLAAGGIALLFVPELRRSGLLAIAASLVFGGMCVWFLRRGGNVPHPPRGGERKTVRSTGPSCPMCGGSEHRPMNAVETTAFYGYDRLVLVRPVLCSQCGRGYEPPAPLWGRVAMVGVAALGVLFGVALASFGPFVSWKAFHDATFDDVRRMKFLAGGGVMVFVGLWWIRRSLKVAGRYIA